MTIKRFWSGVMAVARREVHRIGAASEYRAVLLCVKALRLPD